MRAFWKQFSSSTAEEQEQDQEQQQQQEEAPKKNSGMGNLLVRSLRTLVRAFAIYYIFLVAIE